MRSLLAPITLAVLACSPALADNTKGSQTTDARSTGSFTALTITTAIEVDLVIGSATKVELTGPTAWLPRVETTVKDGVLTISMPGKYKKVPKLKAVITTPALDAITISGVTSLGAKGITGKAFRLDVSGAGELRLEGSVETLAMNLSGAAEVDAKGLLTKKTELSISGTGNVELHATKQVDVSISGVGAVVVHGKPTKVNKQITGTGAVDVD